MDTLQSLNNNNMPEGTAMVICYNWQFHIHVINKKGKNYRNHQEKVLGDNYNQAKFALGLTLKKHLKLERIHLVKPLGNICLMLH